MQSLIDVLIRHGYSVVFGWVLAEQIGLPLPAESFLLAGRADLRHRGALGARVLRRGVSGAP